MMLLLLALFAQEDAAAVTTVRAAAEKIGASSYAYKVSGRFTRTGEFAGPKTLTARIDKFQSIRHGALILVKGPEGLWRTPDEVVGEKVENPGKNVADMVKTLEEAQAPHEMLVELLALSKSGSKVDDHWVLPYIADKIKPELEKQLEKAMTRGTVTKPDEVLWSTARGKVVVFFDGTTGHLVKFREERSVRMVYKSKEGDQEKTYRTEMEFELSAHGATKVEVPAEIKSRLKMD